MQIADYRLNAKVRALLVRRWIDLSDLDYGVTNGVVYLRGRLRLYGTPPDPDPDRSKEVEIAVARRLERTLRQIPGVRDVIFQLEHLVKVGRRWRRK